MSGNFDDFKQELIEAIQRFLIQEYVTDKALKKSNKILLVCNMRNEEIVYQLHPKLCKRLTAKVDLTKIALDACLINMENKQAKLQANLVALLAHIENAENGYNLWRQIKDQIDKIPNSWFFIDNKLTMKSSLKAVLIKYNQVELKASDDISFKKKLADLLIEIQVLLDKIATLLMENNLLKDEIVDLRNTVDQREQVAIERAKLLEEQLQAIRKENAALIEAYRLILESKNNYKAECENLAAENKRLFAVLEEKMAELEQARITFNEENSRAHLHRASLSTCSSAESSAMLIRRFNNEHRNRRSISSVSLMRAKIHTKVESDGGCSTEVRRVNAFYGA